MSKSIASSCRNDLGFAMPPSLDHIGIAVPDLAAAVAPFAALLGPGGAHEEDLPEMKLRVARVPAGAAFLEFVQPLAGEESVRRFLDRYGAGLHHVAFAVPDLDAEVARCRALGHVPVWPAPRRGAGGRRVMFLHPRTTAGVLMELCEINFPLQRRAPPV